MLAPAGSEERKRKATRIKNLMTAIKSLSEDTTIDGMATEAYDLADKMDARTGTDDPSTKTAKPKRKR